MANTYTTLSGLFTAVADAIRSKNGSIDVIIADDFPAEIENLKTGFDYNNQNVTSIADYEFKNCSDLKSVDCYNLTNIGVGAFEGCSNLKTVILWYSVWSVGENAFKGCSEDLTIYCYFDSIPETWHENWNPDGCEVVFVQPEPVETWDVSATEEDNVTAKLYNDIQNEGMYSLVIGGTGNMTNFSSSSIVPWHSDYTSKISNAIIYDGVTRIGSYAFESCKALTYIDIPDSVISIGYRAFIRCTGLTSITIPDSVTYIGGYAFGSCTGLTSITIPDGITNIGDHVFQNCTYLASVIIPDSVTNIYSAAFNGCTSLISIKYTGTVAQWNAISFSSLWNYNTPDYIVYCTDGTIAKDGTITYYES